MTFEIIGLPRANVEALAQNSMDVSFWIDSDAFEEQYCLDAPGRIAAGSTVGLNEKRGAPSYTVRGRD